MQAKIQEVTSDVGKVYKTNSSGNVEVLDYINNTRMLIRFIETGNIKEVQKHNLALGYVSDLPKLVHGAGVYEVGKYFAGKSKEYSLWTAMLGRCYSDTSLLLNPTYVGCSVVDNFKNFQYFAEWCNNQVGFNVAGYQLDKDILSSGTKIYSENTCVFTPPEINGFFTTRVDKGTGVGVFETRSKTFQVKLSCSGKLVRLGNYKSHEEACRVYKVAKEAHAKQLAIKYKGLVDERVIEALNNYTVEVAD